MLAYAAPLMKVKNAQILMNSGNELMQDVAKIESSNMSDEWRQRGYYFIMFSLNLVECVRMYVMLRLRTFIKKMGVEIGSVSSYFKLSSFKL